MSQIKITKAKLNQVKQGTALVIWAEELVDGDKITSPGQVHTAIVQKEIQEGFKKLAIHLAIMSGYLKASDVEDIAAPDEKLSENFHVSQFSIGGDEEEGTSGVILSGKKIITGGRAQNFNTPFYRFEEGEASRYAYMDDLQAILRNLETEIIAYKKGEKRGTPVQQELPLTDKPKATKLQIAEPDPNAKVSPEAKHAGAAEQHKYANADAMQRVAEDDPKPKKGGPRKRVVQTADNPSGEVGE